MPNYLIEVLKVVVFASVFFVWVIRYQNIVEEFRFYGLPNWLRDFVGILKLSCVGLIISKDPMLISIGSAAIALLMGCAVITHIKVKNPFYKMLPSLSLMTCGVIIWLSVNH